MEKNRTLQDIEWLLARLYITTEDAGGDANNIPEFRTLCERYGMSFQNTDEAEEILANGIR